MPRIPINAKSVGPRKGHEIKNLCLLRFSAGKGVIHELPLARPRKTPPGFVQNVQNNRIFTLDNLKTIGQAIGAIKQEGKKSKVTLKFFKRRDQAWTSQDGQVIPYIFIEMKERGFVLPSLNFAALIVDTRNVYCC